jgi:hypothetical protein
MKVKGQEGRAAKKSKSGIGIKGKGRKWKVESREWRVESGLEGQGQRVESGKKNVD